MMFTSDLVRHRPLHGLRVLGLALVAAASAASTSCVKTECGPGTVEKDDECIPADGVSPETDSCGPGTVYSETDGACIPELPPTECGPNTVEEIGEDGQVICVGVGGGSCDQPIACPQPDSAKSTVCGQIRDTETGMPLVEGDGTDTSNCIPDSPAADGPCALEMVVYDALQFATAPEDATPLEVDEAVIDRCGRFRVSNAPVPSSSILAIAVDDSSAGSADELGLSGIAQRVAPGTRVDGRDILSTRHTTDEAWTASAGDPFGGTTFFERGVAIVLFHHGPTPTPGVQATIAGNVRPDDDYYFQTDDAGRTTVDPAADATGMNGAALLINVGLAQVTGEGGEPAGCEWPSELAASPANVVFTTDRLAQDSGGGECP